MESHHRLESPLPRAETTRMRNQSQHGAISFTHAIDAFRTRTVTADMEWVTVFEAISILQARRMPDAIAALCLYGMLALFCQHY